MSNKQDKNQSAGKKHPGTPMIIVGIVLILLSLALVLYNNWESDRAGEASEMALPELETVIFDRQMNGTDEEE